MQSVLFVCLGNICRSPLAEGIFRKIAHERGLSQGLTIDSAGTGAWHVGEPPDKRAIATAARHGVDLSTQRARQAVPGDFHAFDLILAMDEDNHADLLEIDPGGGSAALELFLESHPGNLRSVPDPYYGGPEGFERVYSLIEGAALRLTDRINTARR